MANDPTAPATKQDIELLMQQMARIYDHTTNVKEELEEKLKKNTEEFKAYIGYLQRDFKGAMENQASLFRDITQNHEVRITRVEQRMEAAGIAA